MKFSISFYVLELGIPIPGHFLNPGISGLKYCSIPGSGIEHPICIYNMLDGLLFVIVPSHLLAFIVRRLLMNLLTFFHTVFNLK